MATRWTDCEGFYRRDFLKIGAAGLFGLTLPQLLRLEALAKAAPAGSRAKDHKANGVILLWLGSLATKMLPAEKGVPPYVTFNDFRSGASQSGYLGTAYNPFIIEGAAGGKGGKGATGSLRVRGIQLPTGFTLEELENRDKLLQGFDKTFRSADKSADLVD